MDSNNQEVEMNDESQPINESSQQSASSQGQKRKRNRNKKGGRGGAQGAQEESKDGQQSNNNNNNNQQRRGGAGGIGNGGQPQYQQKKPQNNNNNSKPQGAQAATMMSAGPQQQWNMVSAQGRNQRPQGLNVNERPVAAATEEGFTGPKAGWFDDAEYRRQMLDDFGNRSKHDYYYGSYSSFHIHEEMLKDTVRTRTYQRAIMDNPNDFKDKIVLDIGAGTGILSIFAARAGAKHVYAIEFAEIAIFAQEIIKKNGLQDKITVIKGKMEEITLPVPQVDIIISEWMGYFLLYESMLDSVLWARDKYLAPNTGKMLPGRAQLYVAAIEDGQYKHQKTTFWNDVYGVDMSCLTPTVMKEPLVDTVDSQMIMSDACKVLDLDLVNCRKEDVNFSSQYALNCKYTDRVHGIVAWFDTPFDRLERPVMLSTSPYKKYTHWKQTVFYMEQDLDVREGDTIYGSVACRQSTENFRELDIKISYHYDGAPQGHKTFTNLYKVK